MADIKSKAQGLDPNVKARNISKIVQPTGNVYESLAIITKRSKQLAIDLKHELHNKLEEFAVNTDTIEEVTENKEQIEISKFYEKIPNPTIIATEEFLNEEIHFHYNDKRRKRQ
jgi:DNA-directed RNA polymerase subunit K/omega